jgi:hypothetical protein
MSKVIETNSLPAVPAVDVSSFFDTDRALRRAVVRDKDLTHRDQRVGMNRIEIRNAPRRQAD